MSTFLIVTIIPQKIFVQKQISIIDYQIQNMTKSEKIKTEGKDIILRGRKFGNISSGSSKTSMATETKLIKGNILHTSSGTNNKEEEIIGERIRTIRSLSIQNNKYIVNN